MASILTATSMIGKKGFKPSSIVAKQERNKVERATKEVADHEVRDDHLLRKMKEQDGGGSQEKNSHTLPWGRESGRVHS